MASTSLAASDTDTGYIGIKDIYFRYGSYSVVVGDCNEDGQITLTDLVRLMQINRQYDVVTWDALSVYDCNQDGRINNTDVTLMQNYLRSHDPERS